MSNFAVELSDIVKKFPNPGGGEVIAVNHVDLQIQNGEFFSLLGPSGCGKTTSLRMIAGFEWPNSGEVLIKGDPMGRTPPYLRPVNTVFQSYALFQHMTIAQNVSFGLEMEHTPKPEIDRRVNEALEMVQLGGMGKRKPSQLSGGQQQRIALARALVKRPAVLLLDEPLGALDLKLRKEMQLELKSLQEKVGITFVYVTHDQGEALTMSDRIAVMNKGQVLQIGSPVEIYERPNCRFVADFIGETNFLGGSVVGMDGNHTIVQLDGLGLQLTGLGQGNLRVGQRVAVSARPEKIRLVQESLLGMSVPRNSKNIFPVRVTHTAYVGSDTRVIVMLGQTNRIVVWEQNHISTLDPTAYYSEGDEILLYIPDDNALVLAED
ncbi:MAG: ABC transporter ATP-binding protein [Chloroflexota bacterium]